MCGRYLLGNLPLHVIEELVGHSIFDEHGPRAPVPLPLWNIAPTQEAPVVRVAEDGRRSLDALRWGLIPSWSKDPAIGARCINARAETVAERPAFRAAFRSRRCLVPASGFYEWRKDSRPKQPYVFRDPEGGFLAFAGLWETWTDRATGEVLDTFAIVTTAANAVVGAVHDRMPVVLPRAAWATWLDPKTRDAAVLSPLLVPYEGPLEARAVSTSVNDARNRGRPEESGAGSP